MTVFNLVLGTLGQMALKYLLNSETIEKLVLFGLKKLTEATDSKVDDELYRLAVGKVKK